MFQVIFAHNGVDHASHLESATHQSGSLLWVLATSAATVAALYAGVRYLNNLQARTAEDEEEEL